LIYKFEGAVVPIACKLTAVSYSTYRANEVTGDYA